MVREEGVTRSGDTLKQIPLPLELYSLPFVDVDKLIFTSWTRKGSILLCGFANRKKLWILVVR